MKSDKRKVLALYHPFEDIKINANIGPKHKQHFEFLQRPKSTNPVFNQSMMQESFFCIKMFTHVATQTLMQ